MGRVLEVADEGRQLSKARGFLVSRCEGEEIGRVPLDSIDALILTARSTNLTRALLSALSAEGVPVIFSGENFQPQGILLPAHGRAHAIGCALDQVEATTAFHARLWQQMVKRKIEHQAICLVNADCSPKAIARLNSLISKVKSGDPTNVEAQAARTYFNALFGPAFSRTAQQGGINSHLNDGYAIIRAACARSLCGVGLCPGIGMHHRSRRNPLCLADDLVEIFRPLVDQIVFQSAQKAELDQDLTPTAKASLTTVLTNNMVMEGKRQSVTNAIHQTAHTVATAYAQKNHAIALPRMMEATSSTAA